jgi:hypothetical protein
MPGQHIMHKVDANAKCDQHKQNNNNVMIRWSRVIHGTHDPVPKGTILLHDHRPGYKRPSDLVYAHEQFAFGVGREAGERQPIGS